MSKLPTISGVSLSSKEVPAFTWNADLIEYEGPLLSLYKDEDGNDVLFSWADCDRWKNRWCVVPVDRKHLLAYVSGSASLREIFLASTYVYVVNIGNKGRRTGIVRTQWQQLPQTYVPEANSFLEDTIATDSAKRFASEKPADYTLGLAGDLYLEDMAAIPRVYQQLYSFHYGLSHLARAAVREKLTIIMNKWKGGISAVNFFGGLKLVTPSIHRARLIELRYNSPGCIRLNLLPAMAQEIEATAKRVANPSAFKITEALYKEVYAYLRDQKLSGFDGKRLTPLARNLSPAQHAVLSNYVAKFFELMGWSAYKDAFISLDHSPLAQVRLLLAYYRRLRQLREFVSDGKLELPINLPLPPLPLPPVPPPLV